MKHEELRPPLTSLTGLEQVLRLDQFPQRGLVDSAESQQLLQLRRVRGERHPRQRRSPGGGQPDSSGQERSGQQANIQRVRGEDRQEKPPVEACQVPDYDS